jgi:hypothetical protein
VGSGVGVGSPLVRVLTLVPGGGTGTGTGRHRPAGALPQGHARSPPRAQPCHGLVRYRIDTVFSQLVEYYAIERVLGPQCLASLESLTAEGAPVHHRRLAQLAR